MVEILCLPHPENHPTVGEAAVLSCVTSFGQAGDQFLALLSESPDSPQTIDALALFFLQSKLTTTTIARLLPEKMFSAGLLSHDISQPSQDLLTYHESGILEDTSIDTGSIAAVVRILQAIVKATKDEIQPSPELVEISSFASDLLRFYTGKDALRVKNGNVDNINYHLDIVDNIEPITTLPNSLFRLLTNCIDNSVKAIKARVASEGIGGNITISVQRRDNEMVIRIIDDGIGISQHLKNLNIKDESPTISLQSIVAALPSGEPMSTFSNDQRQPGTGKGSLLCANLANRLGATMAYVNPSLMPEKVGGCIVEIVLPFSLR